MSKPLFCIVGETASGKDTLVRRLINDYDGKLREVVSYTNRPKRETETEGIEHYFRSKEMFTYLYETKKSDIIAYTKIQSKSGTDGYEYMALKEELEKSNVYIIDPNGIEYLKTVPLGDIELVVIYIYASLKERKRRAKASRSDFKKEFKKRVKNEKGQFKKFCKAKAWNYIINNQDGFEDESYTELKNVINKYLYDNK